MKKAVHTFCLLLSIYLTLSGVLWFGVKVFNPAVAVAVAGSNSIGAMKEVDAYALLSLAIGFLISWCCFRLEYPGQSLWRFTVSYWGPANTVSNAKN